MPNHSRIQLAGYVGPSAAKQQALRQFRWAPLLESDTLTLYGDETDRASVCFDDQNGGDLFVVLAGRIQGVPQGESGAAWIRHRYHEFGVAALHGLGGNYLLILRDALRNTFYMVRDDAGAELVYYAGDARGVWFANRLERLLEVIDRPAISPAGLCEYLRFLEISPPRTIYQNVSLLETDKIFKLGGEGIQLLPKQVADSSTNGLSLPPPQIFEHLLGRSIEAHMSGVSRPGAFLSGGIDSALLCAIGASRGLPLRVYTVGFGDERLDESAIATAMAQHLGLPHEVMRFDRDSDLAAFHDFVSNTASPFADPAIIPTLQCYRRVAEEVDRVLDGTGADSLIGNMPARHVRFILDYSRHLPFNARHLLASLLSRLPKLANYAGLFDFGDVRELLIRWRGFTQHELGSLVPWTCDLADSLFFRTFAEHSSDSPYGLYSHLLRAMGDDRIHQTAARLGLQVAFPYQDSALRQYVAGLPQEWKFREGESKRLFRRVLEKYVPSSLWDVPKHGFDYPFHELLAFRNGYLVNEYLNKECLDLHGFFNQKAVGELLRKYVAGDASVHFKIWTLVVFQAWYCHYYQSIRNLAQSGR